MKIEYTSKRFGARALRKIQLAEDIIKEYAGQGYDLTLRQLYYQFVARDLVPNTVREYKNLGNVINDARLAGLINWLSIVDRTRTLYKNPHWSTPADIVRACANQFSVDMWEGQNYRVEVWIEKDALVGVIQGPCTVLDVPYFSCRGYSSQSAMWRAGQRLLGYIEEGQTPVILHLSDHDPSGLDMSRDIRDRLDLFTDYRSINIARVALTIDQVREKDPPPNPAKTTDPRAAHYIAEYGDESWELDALEPRYIETLITETVESYIDYEKLNKQRAKQRAGRLELKSVADKMS